MNRVSKMKLQDNHDKIHVAGKKIFTPKSIAFLVH